jgi:hypothetical protein
MWILSSRAPHKTGQVSRKERKKLTGMERRDRMKEIDSLIDRLIDSMDQSDHL